MKKIILILWIIFVILTFVGSGYVILNGGKPNAGYACIPMVFSLIFGGIYRRIITKEQKTDEND